MSKYAEMVRGYACGWNTWNTRSVLSHVLLPAGLAVNLGVKEYRGGGCLKTVLIGRQGADDEVVLPGPHAYDGSYTRLEVRWRDVELRVESGRDGDDWLALVTPLRQQLKPAALIAELGLLWNRPGTLRKEGERLVAELTDRQVRISATTAHVEDLWTDCETPHLVLSLGDPVGLCSGRSRSLGEIRRLLDAAKEAHQAKAAAYGELAEVYDAVRTCMAWDTIYEPSKGRVVSTVSRIWNVGSGGYSLFCWDTYFAAALAAVDNRELAYCNAVEITRERTPAGFVPNCAHGVFCSYDRSQPPVGSAMALLIYERYGEKWFLDELFDDLLEWNRWWPAQRDTDGLLCWGSNPYPPVVGNYWELNGVDERFGAALESGLDNSPMYDQVPFDAERHQLRLADAGLNGLYVMDCDALAEIAAILGRDVEADELRARGGRYRRNLGRLWSESFGLYLNRRTDTGEFSPRISPTNFYPLLARAATGEQARRMIDEHLYHPQEFWGDWVLPSIARNDPAYGEQNYWRGRIWAPMNFLVYLGLRNYDLPEARSDLAAKSVALLLKEWREHGHIHENYNADSGAGCDMGNSDRFYHWGALLGLIGLMEAGHLG